MRLNLEDYLILAKIFWIENSILSSVFDRPNEKYKKLIYTGWTEPWLLSCLSGREFGRERVRKTSILGQINRVTDFRIDKNTL